MSAFETNLSRLCSAELAEARKDAQRGGAMVQEIVASLALTIAVVSKGDRDAMNTLLEGAAQYLFEETAARAAVGKLLGGT